MIATFIKALKIALLVCLLACSLLLLSLLASDSAFADDLPVCTASQMWQTLVSSTSESDPYIASSLCRQNPDFICRAIPTGETVRLGGVDDWYDAPLYRHQVFRDPQDCQQPDDLKPGPDPSPEPDPEPVWPEQCENPAYSPMCHIPTCLIDPYSLACQITAGESWNPPGGAGGGDGPDNPYPDDPDPTDPSPTDPDPADPDPTEPVPTDPGPTDPPDPVDPDPTPNPNPNPNPDPTPNPTPNPNPNPWPDDSDTGDGWLDRIYNRIMGLPSAFASAMSSLFGSVSDAVASTTNAVSQLPSQISSALSNQFDKLADRLSGVKDATEDVAEGVGGIRDDLANLSDDLSAGLGSVDDSVNRLPGEIADALSDKLDAIVDAINAQDGSNPGECAEGGCPSDPDLSVESDINDALGGELSRIHDLADDYQALQDTDFDQLVQDEFEAEKDLVLGLFDFIKDQFADFNLVATFTPDLPSSGCGELVFTFLNNTLSISCVAFEKIRSILFYLVAFWTGVRIKEVLLSLTPGSAT